MQYGYLDAVAPALLAFFNFLRTLSARLRSARTASSKAEPTPDKRSLRIAGNRSAFPPGYAKSLGCA